MEKIEVLKGCEFLLKEVPTDHIFVEEDRNEEQLMIQSMIRDFYLNEIKPNVVKIDKQEPGLSEKLMLQIGDLGLLSAHMPDKYNGLGYGYYYYNSYM